MLIDAHCHFFTNSILAERMKKDVKNIIRLSKRIDESGSNAMIQGAADFLTTNVENTPERMYEIMKEGYGCDFIAVPLMMDLSYSFISPENERKTDTSLQKAFTAAKESNWNFKRLDEIKKKFDTFENSVLGIDVFENSYQQQIDDLTKVKSKMPDRVYPFFSVDPRRNHEFEGGILSEIKKYVGKDKPFLGLKLYSSLGYSPTDPVLYDDNGKESVYGYCEKHKIPITVHSSIEGFSHFLDKNHVKGDVYYPDAGRCVPAESIYDNGVISYKNNIPSINYEDITRERLIILNHPIIWRKVLEKYPKLKINMAHFGGVTQAYKFAKDDKSAFWPEYIIELMEDFSNVYTDLSCYYEQDNNPDYMKLIYKKIYKELPRKSKNKVMFGSDYYMLALYNTTPKQYIEKFREAFNKRDFARISEDNSRRFLDI